MTQIKWSIELFGAGLKINQLQADLPFGRFNLDVVGSETQSRNVRDENRGFEFGRTFPARNIQNLGRDRNEDDVEFGAFGVENPDAGIGRNRKPDYLADRSRHRIPDEHHDLEICCSFH